jgi:hypothetical protein
MREGLRDLSRFSSLFAPLREERMTMLGVGPMSRRIVEETILLANQLKLPIALIPSRRQIECHGLGGGYVESWSTEDFVQFVRDRDRGNFVILSRDHSGPWQFKVTDNSQKVIPHNKAMEEAKASLATDIELGFDVLHLDPSLGLNLGRSELEVQEDLLDLYSFCFSREGGQAITYEVGADEQSMVPDLPSIAEEKFQKIATGLKSRGLPLPQFYVLQTGTKVKETRNIGSFSTHIPVKDMLSPSFQIPEILKICEKYNILLKEHNADYLPDDSLRWHRLFGIPAANVAPEFGVVETRSLLQIAMDSNENWFIDLFGERVLGGGRWEKWLLPESSATERDKIEIAGHYHFAEKEIQEAIQKLESRVQSRGVDVDKIRRDSIRKSINRYLRYFGYYG